jgi:hypothetical protein
MTGLCLVKRGILQQGADILVSAPCRVCIDYGVICLKLARKVELNVFEVLLCHLKNIA